MSSTNWFDEPESKPAPEPLAAIQALVNTVDLESGLDRLAEPVEGSRWLAAHGLLSASTTATPAELRQVTAFREALRAMLVHNAGGPAPGVDARRTLREVAGSGGAQLTVDDAGTVGVGAVGESVQARLISLLLVVRDAQRDGTWALLKACANGDCQWAFYDRSRNHGGTWCDMAACGNKLKNRDFRARQRKAQVT